jgi:hypothetical protein
MAHGKKTKAGVERDRFSALDEPLTPSAIIHLLDLRRDWPTLASSRREDAAATRPTEQPYRTESFVSLLVSLNAISQMESALASLNSRPLRLPCKAGK